MQLMIFKPSPAFLAIAKCSCRTAPSPRRGNERGLHLYQRYHFNTADTRNSFTSDIGMTEQCVKAHYVHNPAAFFEYRHKTFLFPSAQS